MGQGWSLPLKLFTTLVWVFYHAAWGCWIPFCLVSCRCRMQVKVTTVDICSFQLNVCTRNFLNVWFNHSSSFSTEISHSLQWLITDKKPTRLHLKDHFNVRKGIKYHSIYKYILLMVKLNACDPCRSPWNNVMIHFHIACADASEQCHRLHVNICLDESPHFLSFFSLQTIHLNTRKQLNL